MLGARIRALRLARGWTQAQLADRTQVSATYISMLERGRDVHPTAPALGRLAVALDVRLADLVAVSPPLEPAPAAPAPAPRADSDVEFQRLAKVWPHIRPALWPYLVELANTLATISRMLDSEAAAAHEAPATSDPAYPTCE